MRLELKTYQGVKQLWTKWDNFKRYVKVWKEEGGLFFSALLSCFPFLLSFPSDLPKWVFLEQTEMVFAETKNYFPMETALRTQWNSSHRPQMHRKSKTRNPFKFSATPVLDLDQNRKRLFIKDLIPCSGTQGTPKIPNTLSNRFTQIDHRSVHWCLSCG